MVKRGDLALRAGIRHAIIDADNPDPTERKETGSLKDFPMILPLQEGHLGRPRARAQVFHGEGGHDLEGGGDGARG